MIEKKFEIGDIVVHSAIGGKKFRIIKIVNPSQYEIEDMISGKILLEPLEYLLDIVDSRDQLINFLLEN